MTGLYILCLLLVAGTGVTVDAKSRSKRWMYEYVIWQLKEHCGIRNITELKEQCERDMTQSYCEYLQIANPESFNATTSCGSSPFIEECENICVSCTPGVHQYHSNCSYTRCYENGYLGFSPMMVISEECCEVYYGRTECDQFYPVPCPPGKTRRTEWCGELVCNETGAYSSIPRPWITQTCCKSYFRQGADTFKDDNRITDCTAKYPVTIFEKPSVSVHLDHEATVSKLVFHCNVVRSALPVLYTTDWFVNYSSDPMYTSEETRWPDEGFDYLAHSALTEDILRANDINKPGFRVGCAVRVKHVLSGEVSEGQISERYFVGIKIKKTYFYLEDGQRATVHVNVTVPFGCGNVHGHPCLFPPIEMSLAGSRCKVGAVAEAECGFSPISADTWFSGASMNVVGKAESTYSNSFYHYSRMYIKTKKSNVSSLWDDYSIGSVRISVKNENQQIRYKGCHARHDPYIFTFSERWFELMDHGVYTMFKDNATDVEVQIKTEACGSARVASCTCGVAIRSGRTVFEISICDSEYWVIGFTACDSNWQDLDVNYRWSQYMISLPGGQLLNVYVSTRSRLVNVSIYPTVEDKLKSRGLCDVLSTPATETLVTRSGTTTTLTHIFSQSWRVEDNNNLFNPDMVSAVISETLNVKTYCTCSGTDISCSRRKAPLSCISAAHFQRVKPRDCSVLATRKRRAVRNNNRRVKREINTSNTWRNGFTEALATQYCDTKFNLSSSVSLLKDVPGIDFATIKKECVQDIKNSGSTEFADVAVSNIRVQAVREEMVNPDLSKKNSSDISQPTLSELISLRTCPEDCSQRGTCVMGGVCECAEGYGGDDCSVDLTVPPVVYTTGAPEMCDLSTMQCTDASLIGSIFSGSEDAKCQIKKHKVLETGEIRNASITTSHAELESISEVWCSFPDVDADDVVTLYVIAVSQSGDNYSNPLSVFVYDSSCISVDHQTRVWTKQNGYCIHKGICAAFGESRGDNSCLKCGIINGRYYWSQSQETGCSTGDLILSNESGAEFTVLDARLVFLVLAAACLY